MNDTSNKELRHGQALAIQWVVFVLQKITTDIRSGGTITRQLIGDARTVDGQIPWEQLETAYNYVSPFILPFAIELALKALLEKKEKSFGKIHDLSTLYSRLPENTINKLEEEFLRQKNGRNNFKYESLKQLLDIHKSDFPDWRYLDDIEKVKNLKMADEEMQIAICTILEIYNSNE